MKLEANMLAFARSIQPSEAPFSAYPTGAGRGARVPVPVVEKSARGQISNYISGAKTFNIDKANLQTIDYAMVPPGCDRLLIEFSLLVTPMSRRPYATSDHAVMQHYEKLSEAYHGRGGYRFLAGRYLWNIANARWAWRNRYLLTEPLVELRAGADVVTFDPFKLSLESYPGWDMVCDAAVEGPREAVDRLRERFAAGLGEDDASFSCTCSIDAGVLPMMEVFPSQEMPSEDTKRARDKVGRILSSIETFDAAGRPVRQATFHSQKVGAAIRHVDEWHGAAEMPGLAVAVNPYAGVIERGLALRPPRRGAAGGAADLYTLMKRGPALLGNGRDGKPFADLDQDDGDLHFVMANLVRGGVFGLKEA